MKTRTLIGLLLQLALSWLIAWAVERKDLRVLGLRPTRKRIGHFFLFLLLTAACAAAGPLMKDWFGEFTWKTNPLASPGLIWEGLWWNLRSVLFEELIFRGVLLYILIRKLGTPRALLISAATFGIYHWFSFGIIGNIPQMTLIFIITGLMGWVYALAYARTYSLYVSSGIHLGWNFTQGFIFSEGSIGAGVLVPSGPPFRTDSFLIAFLVFFLPMLAAFLINFFMVRNLRQVPFDLPAGKVALQPTIKPY